MVEKNIPNPFIPQALAQSVNQNSPQVNASIGTLFDALSRIKITKERQYFLNQNINLDGQKFIECRFDQCTLTTDTGDISLQNCVFGEGNVVYFGQNTKKIVQLATLLDPNLVSPQLYAEVKQNGSIKNITII